MREYSKPKIRIEEIRKRKNYEVMQKRSMVFFLSNSPFGNEPICPIQIRNDRTQASQYNRFRFARNECCSGCCKQKVRIKVQLQSRLVANPGI